MNPMRLLAALSVTTAGLALLAVGSATPLRYHAEDSAALRLSWSARPERIEVCTAVSAEELARLEEHMRQSVICEGSSASYLLRVEADGEAIGESTVLGAGLRHDRPLYLLHDYSITEGQHRVRVTFTRREQVDQPAASQAGGVSASADTGLYAGRAEREVTERVRRIEAAIPPVLVLDTTVVFARRKVVLITFNSEQKILELKRGGTQ